MEVGIGNMTFCTDLDITCNSQQNIIVEIDPTPTQSKEIGGSIHNFSAQIWIFHAFST